jgi:plastocyanin
VAAKGGVEYFGMVPASLTVAPGTTVKFQMTKGSYEAHTATFGPGNIEDPASYLGGIAASFESPAIDPRGTYPSDVSPVAVNPKLHGNGFWNSGVLDAANASPLPGTASVKFDTPGSYKYYCLIHPFMVGTVVVQ